MVQKPSESWFEHNLRLISFQSSKGYKRDYHVSHHSFDAADFGIPQHRCRVIIVATYTGYQEFTFPDFTHSRDQLIRAKMEGDYWERHQIPKARHESFPQPSPPPSSDKKPWVTVRDALADLPAPSTSETDAWMNHWMIPGARSYPGHTGSKLDWPSKTIKAGVHGVPGGENTVVDDDGKFRYYTLREAARIQTFPDNHYFSGARIHVTRQIGNAVPSSLAELFGKSLFPILNPSKPSRKRN